MQPERRSVRVSRVAVIKSGEIAYTGRICITRNTLKPGAQYEITDKDGIIVLKPIKDSK